MRALRLRLSLGDEPREGAIAASAHSASAANELAAAHAALKADSSIQFHLAPARAEPETPSWLKAVLEWLGNALEPVGRFLRWIGSFLPDAAYARILLWTVLTVAAVAVAWSIYHRLRTGEWRLPRLHAARPAELDREEDWAPEADPARSWLEEADALASVGRYSEAVHHLLFRSIEDIARRRPQAVRPALTSREIAAAEVIPGRARQLFTAIARLVERSLFGGRPVGEPDWLAAREAYADFALPQAWRA